MRCLVLILMVTGGFYGQHPGVAEAIDVEHVVVHHEAGRFGGWPANHGMWSWDNELLVGFSYLYYRDMGRAHHVNREKPEEHLLARSMDGGKTWTVEFPNREGYLIPQGGGMHGIQMPDIEIPELTPSPGEIDFAHPDFAMTMRMVDKHIGPSSFHYSYDRGRSWAGPFVIPVFDTPGIAARTDYIVDGPDTCTLFLTAAKSDGLEGRPLAVRTDDGGATWEFLSWIAPEERGYGIMPATVRLSATELVTLVRHRDGDARWISAHRSLDNGASWAYCNTPTGDATVGNPASLIMLYDGRLCFVYGYRRAPYGIRARLSNDGGRSWSDEYILRDDGASGDLGYPRTVQRPDGKIVTVYYYCDNETGPERYIAATIWTPPTKE